MTALVIIVIILMATIARFYVKKRYNVSDEKNAIHEALNRNHQARVRSLHVAHIKR